MALASTRALLLELVPTEKLGHCQVRPAKLRGPSQLEGSSGKDEEKDVTLDIVILKSRARQGIFPQPF